MPSRIRAPKNSPAVEEAGAMLPYSDSSREDRRRFRIAVAVAVIAHLALFAVTFPDAAAQSAPEPEQKKVYVIQQTRFKKPPPRQQEPIPEQRTKRVPIPDPTPDEPEPIRELEALEQPEPELPPMDWVTEIPDAPPAPPEPAPSGPIALSAEVTRPVRIAGSDPLYTELARRAGIRGPVVVQLTVDENGDVVNVKLIRDLPMGLGDATVKAVKNWHFKPATMRGKPVAVYYNLTVDFGLQ